jgi:hypothetical protein
MSKLVSEKRLKLLLDKVLLMREHLLNHDSGATSCNFPGSIDGGQNM